MFMRRPSPLSLRVRSKFAELYLLPKKEVLNIAKNYKNIWRKIHKKDFHNMLSIKHKTFNILKKYIDINGIRKIDLNDVSRFVYAWEDPEKKNNRFKKYNEEKQNTFDNIIKSKDKNTLYFKKNLNGFCPSPIPIRIDRNNIPNNKNNKNDYLNNNLFSNHSLDKVGSPKSKEHQPILTENDFSHLLILKAKEKQKSNDVNNNPNENNKNSFNINKNNNNIIKKNSSDFLASNFFNDKRKINDSYNEDNTIILPKNSERLIPTLHNIFNEKKAEEIKNEMKKSKKKENRKKLYIFGKKTAKLFRNDNYSIFLLGKNTNELIEVKKNNKFNLSNNFLIKNNGIDNSELTQYIPLFQDNNFLDKIPEMSSNEEYSLHRFDKNELSKEEVISFSINSIYKNINIHTKMNYSKSNYFQEKTLDYLTKLIGGKVKYSSTFNSNDSELSDPNSIVLSFSDNEKKSYIYKEFYPSLTNSIIYSNKSDNLVYRNILSKSDSSKKDKNIIDNVKKKYNSQTKNIKIELSDKINDYNSLQNIELIKSKIKNHSDLKRTEKYAFKIGASNNEKSSDNDINSNQNKKSKITFSNLIGKKTNNYLNLNINPNKKNLSLFSDNIIGNNNKLSSKNNNSSKIRSNYTESKSRSKKVRIKDKLTKKKQIKMKNNNVNIKHKISQYSKKFKTDNYLEYFAKEEKEDCMII